MTENIRNRIKVTPLGGLLPVLVLCLFAAASTWGDVKDGVAAYERGDYKTALDRLRPLAEQGDAEAQYHLGLMYYGMYDVGKGVFQDDVEAVKWFTKAAQQNHASAQYILGLMYYSGKGVVQDYVEAAKWYRKAAEQNLLRVTLALHLLYNVDEVYKEFHKAAEQGNAEAQYHLGAMYDDGYGVVQDDVAAVKWYTKAAQQNHARAQYNLGVMYVKGEGVVQNYVTAVKWYTKAAQQPHAKVILGTGMVLLCGKTMPEPSITLA